MTTRTVGALALAAAAIASVALLARPFLPPHASSASASPTSPPPGIARLAADQARRGLSCTTTVNQQREPGESCGRLRVARREITCPTPTRCIVELVGDLHTTAITAPIALTVTMVRVRATWRVIELAS